MSIIKIVSNVIRQQIQVDSKKLNLLLYCVVTSFLLTSASYIYWWFKTQLEPTQVSPNIALVLRAYDSSRIMVGWATVLVTFSVLLAILAYIQGRQLRRSIAFAHSSLVLCVAGVLYVAYAPILVFIISIAE